MPRMTTSDSPTADAELGFERQRGIQKAGERIAIGRDLLVMHVSSAEQLKHERT